MISPVASRFRSLARRLRGEEGGFALIAALIVMMIVSGLALALLASADGQQRATGNEQTDEESFALAEAALNSQIFELSNQWPTSSSTSWPTSCNEASAGTLYCPTASATAGSFAPGYAATSGTCSTATPHDVWNSSPANGWTTYVRDDGGTPATANLYNSAADQTQPSYDANGDNVLWVRAVGVVNCQSVAVVQQVSQRLVPVSFPELAINANGFETSNNGNKTIVDLTGKGQPSEVAVRCNGYASKATGPGTTCTNYAKAEQLNPTPTFTTSPANTLTAAQIANVKAQAMTNKTYFDGTAQYPCPTSITQLTGSPTFIMNCGNLSFTGNGQANSAASPGYVVLYNGTLSLGGTTNFYGLIYAVNSQGSSGDVVTLSGNAQVQGGITVDGNGTVNFGSSGLNLSFDPTIFPSVSNTTVSGVPNSFRVLPQSQ